MDPDTGVYLAANAYEHPAFSVTGQRKRRKITTTVHRRYFVVNPALVSTDPIESDFSASIYTNCSQSYKTTRIGEYLWAVEKMVIEYGSWEADKHVMAGETTEPELHIVEGNYPEVDDSGYYHYYHWPLISDSVFGADQTAGKVSFLKTVYD